MTAVPIADVRNELVARVGDLGSKNKIILALVFNELSDHGKTVNYSRHANGISYNLNHIPEEDLRRVLDMLIRMENNHRLTIQNEEMMDTLRLENKAKPMNSHEIELPHPVAATTTTTSHADPCAGGRPQTIVAASKTVSSSLNGKSGGNGGKKGGGVRSRIEKVLRRTSSSKQGLYRQRSKGAKIAQDKDGGGDGVYDLDNDDGEYASGLEEEHDDNDDVGEDGGGSMSDGDNDGDEDEESSSGEEGEEGAGDDDDASITSASTSTSPNTSTDTDTDTDTDPDSDSDTTTTITTDAGRAAITVPIRKMERKSAKTYQDKGKGKGQQRVARGAAGKGNRGFVLAPMEMESDFEP